MPVPVNNANSYDLDALSNRVMHFHTALTNKDEMDGKETDSDINQTSLHVEVSLFRLIAHVIYSLESAAPLESKTAQQDKRCGVE